MDNLFNIENNIYTNLIIPSEFIIKNKYFIDIDYRNRSRHSCSIDEIVTIKKYAGFLSNNDIDESERKNIFQTDSDNNFINLIIPKEYLQKINFSPDINFIGRNINNLTKEEIDLINKFKTSINHN